jgi:sensor domain CHASE-containing protein
MYRTLSWRNIPTARTLFAMVFIAGIGLIISIVALLYLSLHLISTKTNEIDEHRSALSVQGAIQTSVNRVSSLVLDNAVWDDAVRETYRPTLDPAGCITPGALALKSNLYDGTFVLDEHFNVIWGSFQSQPFKERTSIFLVKASKGLLTSTDEPARR